jgi:hypothetical protein
MVKNMDAGKDKVYNGEEGEAIEGPIACKIKIHQ